MDWTPFFHDPSSPLHIFTTVNKPTNFLRLHKGKIEVNTLSRGRKQAENGHLYAMRTQKHRYYVAISMLLPCNN